MCRRRRARSVPHDRRQNTRWPHSLQLRRAKPGSGALPSIALHRPSRSRTASSWSRNSNLSTYRPRPGTALVIAAIRVMGSPFFGNYFEESTTRIGADDVAVLDAEPGAIVHPAAALHQFDRESSTRCEAADAGDECDSVGRRHGAPSSTTCPVNVIQEASRPTPPGR